MSSSNPVRRHFIALWTEASQGGLGPYDKKQWLELEGCLDLLMADWAKALTPEAVTSARTRAVQLVELLSGATATAAESVQEHWAELRRAISS